jgi:hypothetical protein
MKREYYLSLSFRTPKGIETYGRYELGRDKNFAIAIFDELKGEEEVSESSILHIDLTESEDGVPFVRNVKHCTLDEIAENTKLITLQLFKRDGLEAAS